MIAVLLCALGLTCPPAHAGVIRTLDFQPTHLRKRDGHPRQWDNYVPEPSQAKRFGTSGISLGTPGSLPYPFTQAARFQSALDVGRPRSMAILGRDTLADHDTRTSGPVDAAEGLDRYYSWSTYFPKDFRVPLEARKALTIFQAWHGDSKSQVCNPSVSFQALRLADGNAPLHLQMDIIGGRFSYTEPKWHYEREGFDGCRAETWREVDLGPIVRGRWIHWKVHMKWSAYPSRGLTEVVRDGHRFVVKGANLFKLPSGESDHGYMEHGIYIPQESSASARKRSLWQVGMRIATRAADLRVRHMCRRLRVVSPARGVRISRRSTSKVAPTLRLARSAAPATVRIDRRGIAFLVGRTGRAQLPAHAFDRRGVHRLGILSGGRARTTVRVRSRRC